MKRNNIYTIVFLMITLIGFSACKDNELEEVTKLQVDRTFSPTDLSASIVNKTGIRLSWKAVNNAKTYTIEVFENADFSGTPIKSVGNITFAQLPYTVTGLAGDTHEVLRGRALRMVDKAAVAAVFQCQLR